MNPNKENIIDDTSNYSHLRSIKPSLRIALEEPGRDITEPTLIHLPPEKNIEHYMVSKAICKKLEICPKRETIFYDSTRKCNEALQQYNYATQLWEEKIAELAKSRTENEKIISSLIDNETDLRNTHITFEELVVSNVYKRTRCKRILKDVVKAIGQKDNEIEKLQKQIKKFQQAQVSLEKNVEKYKLYADFLLEFLVLEPKFKNIDNIVKRYDELSSVRRSIVREQAETIVAADNLRGVKTGNIELQKSLVSGLQNEVIKLEKKYNHARHATFYWERMQYHARKGCLDRMFGIERVVQSGYNMYEDMCCRTGSTLKININEKMRLFQFLKNVLQFYEAVVEIAVDLYEKQLSSGYVETEGKDIESDYFISFIIDNEEREDKSDTDIFINTVKQKHILEE